MASGPGTGTTVAFSGSGSFSGEITNVEAGEESIPVLDVSHFLSTNYREKVGGDLAEPPQFTMQLNFEPDNPPPAPSKTVLTMTITFNGGANTFTGSGFVVSRSASIPNEDVMTATFVFQCDGKSVEPAYS